MRSRAPMEPLASTANSTSVPDRASRTFWRRSVGWSASQPSPRGWRCRSWAPRPKRVERNIMHAPPGESAGDIVARPTPQRAVALPKRALHCLARHSLERSYRKGLADTRLLVLWREPRRVLLSVLFLRPAAGLPGYQGRRGCRRRLIVMLGGDAVPDCLRAVARLRLAGQTVAAGRCGKTSRATRRTSSSTTCVRPS